MQRPRGAQGLAQGTVLSHPPIHLKPTLEHLLCVRLFLGHGLLWEAGSGALALGHWPWQPILGCCLGLCFFPKAAMLSSAKSERAFLAPASSRENGFQISITVGFQQHLNGLPQAQQPWLSRTTGAKTKVGLGNPSLLPEPGRGPVDSWWLQSVRFIAQEVDKEIAG